MKITPEPLRVDSFEAVILSMQNLVLFKYVKKRKKKLIITEPKTLTI